MMAIVRERFAVLLMLGALLIVSLLAPLAIPVFAVEVVTPVVETEPVNTERDAADDPAIWVHPTNRALSTIIGTNKKDALEVYALDGTKLQVIPLRTGNVDIRYNFPLGGERVDLVVAFSKTTKNFVAFKVNPATRQLQNVTASDVADVDSGGTALYHSQVTGKYYYFSNHDGRMRQYELVDNGSGKVTARLVREVEFGSRESESVVADDVYGHVYISDETVGVWKLSAEPNGGPERTLVDRKSSEGGHLNLDVEGLAIYYTSDGGGYLLASNQGGDNFTIYERRGKNKYLGTFAVGDGNGIDGVSNTDGIDVTNVALGPHFPQGLFVAQDGRNDQGNQNFKLVRWQDIAGRFSPALTIDTTWDPRRVGRP